MNDIIRLNGVAVDIEEARKALAEHDAKQAEAGKLYDGLTLEQWQYVIDGKFLCEFWDDNCEPADSRGVSWLDEVTEPNWKNTIFRWCRNAVQWEHCRPAQVYGLRHPCFGKRPEWLKDSDLIVMAIWEDGPMTTSPRVTVGGFRFTGCIEFIAMPAGGKIG